MRTSRDRRRWAAGSSLLLGALTLGVSPIHARQLPSGELRGTYAGTCQADRGEPSGDFTLQIAPARRAATVPLLRGSGRFAGGESLRLHGSLSRVEPGATGACTLANRSGSSLMGLQFEASPDGTTIMGRYVLSNREGEDLGRGSFTLTRVR